MNLQLAIAALLSTTLAVSHSWLGERLILQPILGVQDLPKLRGSRRGMQKIVRFAWHLTSVYFLAVGVILFYFSRATRDVTVIEIISYLTRPISLSVRLFANMMAGHTMLAVFGSFVVGLGILGGWVPLVFMVALMGLEIMIAFLQAYVFAVLSCIYLNDALHASEH